MLTPITRMPATCYSVVHLGLPECHVIRRTIPHSEICPDCQVRDQHRLDREPLPIW